MRGRMTLLAMALAMLATTGHAMTAEDLVQKNIEARGGRAAIDALERLKFSGTMRFGGGDSSFELEMTQLVSRGVGCRNEATLQGLTAIRVYGVESGWSVSPFQGRRDPERISPDEFKADQYCNDLAGPLVDHQKKGHTLAYLGTEDVDGTLAHKLKVTLANGNTETLFLDPDFFLEIRGQTRSRVRGVEVESETDYGNYEKVGGVFLPFSIESGEVGGPKTQKIEITRAEANPEIDPAVFAFPTGGQP